MGVVPAVSVVIPTRSRPAVLPRSVAAVLDQQTSVPFEILVVDDDHEPLRCRLPNDPRLRIVRTGGRGVCAARNLGIREARAPIVAFTDDDTVAPRSWISTLTDALAARPGALGVEGPVEYGCEPDRVYQVVPSAPFPGGYCSCNVAYRRDALLAAGLFDERFRRPGAEDVDLGLRIAALGPVIAEPTMVMRHPPRSIGLGEAIRRGHLVENDWLLHEKHRQLAGPPSRFGSLVWRARAACRAARDPAVVQGSPTRLARVVATGVGVVALGFAVACTTPMPRVDR